MMLKRADIAKFAFFIIVISPTETTLQGPNFPDQKIAMQFLFKIYRQVLQAVSHKPSDRDPRARAFCQTLVQKRIARPDQIVGCSPNEIASLEARLGRFPQSYRSVLATLGKSAGLLVVREEMHIYADQLADNASRGADYVALWAQDGVALEVPQGAIFIATRYGEHPVFILSGERADSPVWLIDSDEGTVRRIADGVWDYFEGFIDEGERLVARTARQ